MENGDLDITFHMESFFWPVRFIASLIWKLLLIVLNFYNEACRVPAIYSKIEGTYLPIMGAYKKKLGDLGNEELRQRTIEKQSPNPVKEHIIQTDENRKRLYRRLAVFLVFAFTIIASISVTFYQQNSSIKAKEAKVKDMKKNWIH